jgi:hypothetical protein
LYYINIIYILIHKYITEFKIKNYTKLLALLFFSLNKKKKLVPAPLPPLSLPSRPKGGGSGSPFEKGGENWLPFQIAAPKG